MQTAKARQAGKSRQTCLSCGQMPEVADIDVRGSAEEGDNMLYIDGCAADVFSAGVVLYELVSSFYAQDHL